MSTPAPVPIDANLSAPECPSAYGPFNIGGKVYTIQYSRPTDSTAELVCSVSSNGVTFARIDSAHNQSIDANSGLPVLYTCVVIGTMIWCLLSVTNDESVGVAAFNTVTGLWVDQSNFASTSPPGFNVVNPSWVAAVRGTDIVFAMPCFIAVTANGSGNGILHNVPGFAVYDTVGDAWGDFTQMDTLDTATVSEWDQVPCGIVTDSDGRVLVFSQQITFLYDGQSIGFSYGQNSSWVPPLDCVTITGIEAVGGGSGASSGGLPQAGGGGGAYAGVASQAVVQGDTYLILADPGPAVGVTAAPTQMEDFTAGDPPFISAAGGTASTVNTVPGTGGLASACIGDTAQSGGDGGLTLAGGGGGGGAGSPGVDGGVGGTATGTLGGAGGTSADNGTGGSGGDQSTDGNGGNAFGGGGGGAGALAPTSANGTGGNGGISFGYTPVRTSYSGRLFIQSVLSDNSLGSLTYIEGCDFPVLNANGPDQILTFDVKAENGITAFVISGTSNGGYGNVLLGSADNSDTPTYTIDVAATGANFPIAPSIAFNAPDFYITYLVGAQIWSSVNGAAAVNLGTGIKGSRLQSNFDPVLGFQLIWGQPNFATLAGEDVG